MLACLKGGYGYLVVGVARRDDINQSYVVALQEETVVRLVTFPAQSGGGIFHSLLVAAADCAHPRDGVHLEEARYLAVGVGVGPAHELVADEADAYLAHVHHASPGLSVMTASLRKATAFLKPSSTLIRESSCSMEITPSYPASLSSLAKARQKSGP